MKCSVLIDKLEDLCRSATRGLVLVAPFMKVGVLARLLHQLPTDVPVTAVTRWWPQEIAAGVSDIEIWDLFRTRAERRLWVRNDLHAKLYQADDTCLVGSANLTAKALGLSSPANFELLLQMPASDPTIVAFHSQLWNSAVEVTEDLFDLTRSLVDALTPLSGAIEIDAASVLIDSPELGRWLPQLRQPEDLRLAYEGRYDELSSAAAYAATVDLETLHVPRGLDGETFREFVGVALLRTPVIAGIDEFVSADERRFGEMRRKLAELDPLSDPSRDWQTIFRWLLYFLPDRYEYRRPHFSELIRRRGPTDRAVGT